MTKARQFDSVRTTMVAESLFDGRAVPAGMEGAVLKAYADGTCLVELTFTPQTIKHDGDFALAELTEDQYEIIEPWPDSPDLDLNRPERS